jgi:hypothetical protein
VEEGHKALVVAVLLTFYYDARSTSAAAVTSKHLAAFDLILNVLQLARLTVKTKGGQFVCILADGMGQFRSDRELGMISIRIVNKLQTCLCA